MIRHLLPISRRRLLQAGAGAAAVGCLPASRLLAAPVRDYHLTLAPGTIQLADAPFPKTAVWAINEQVPGPLLRCRKGETLRVAVRNNLVQPTTMHWHGLRIANDMDGVPLLTQAPIMPGQTFQYEFTPPDAGTYWYHSHVNTAEQIGRGIYGVLIVDEEDPPRVDRDEVWVLDDWRLDNAAQIVDDFDNHRDFSRAGRLGNTITVNSRISADFPVRSNERIRLRLVNAANARIFALRFRDHDPWIVAHDGQPVKPYRPEGGVVQIASAQRVDLILDLTGAPGSRSPVIDTFNPQAPFRLRDLVYGESPMRLEPLDTPIALPENAYSPIDLANAKHYDVVLDGGDLGDLNRAELRGQIAGMAQLVMMGKMWAINGIVGYRMNMPPQFDFRRGETGVLKFINHSAWPHPMHLHGHHFEVISHSGDARRVGRRLDTVLLGPGEQASVAFVADNPGDWLFHCHIVTHAEAGMTAVVKVA
ncbi:MAG: multicopper oxidase family protein [Gammaproteobacteria bacterium]|nr:multicopper oxidase family protein [Gammaproteobacteria bacterium]